MLRTPASLPGLGLALITACFLGPAAEAGQLFVNPVTGSDANSGASPEAAFKTIRKALEVAPPFNDGIFLAPGEYGASSGELFPLPLGHTVLHGTEGSAVTRVVGTGNDILFDAVSTGAPESTILNMQGISLLGGGVGLRVNSFANGYIVKLTDLVISGMSQDGIEALAIPSGATPSSFALQATHLTITDCLRGLSALPASPDLTSQVSLVACRFERNAVGLNYVSGTGGSGFVSIFLSRFTEHSVVGLRAFANGGDVDLAVEGSLVTGNAFGIEAGGLEGVTQFSVHACTIADNGVGIFTDLPAPPSNTRITSSIVWNNGDDLQLGGRVIAEYNDVSDGDFGSIDGNVSIDPLFRDAAAGDYRLTWGSPVIEAGGPAPAFDLASNVRPVDGNLDAVSVSDIGCLEFMPLELVKPLDGLLAMVPLGGQVQLEAWGEACMSATLFVAPGSFGTPTSSGFGFFFLPMPSVIVGSFLVGSTQPGTLAGNIPSDPALQGLYISLQALTTSSAAPKFAALTSPQQFVIGE